MPLYSFHCPSCGKEFDRFLRLSRLKDGAVCPACSAPAPHPAAGGPAQASAPSSALGPAPGQGSCLIPQRG